MFGSKKVKEEDEFVRRIMVIVDELRWAMNPNKRKNRLDYLNNAKRITNELIENEKKVK